MTRSRFTSLGIATAFLIVSISCGGMSGTKIQGSGVAKTEQRDVGAFKNVRIDGSANVDITVGEPGALAINADDNILDIVTTEVHGDTLVISSKESYSTRIGVNVTITTPDLAGVEINGAGDIKVKGLKAEKFSAIIRGSGDVQASGTTGDLTAEIKGSGDLRLGELEAKLAHVSVAGSGDGTVNVADELTVSVAGSGDVRYKGSPKIQKSIAGSGSVKPVG